MVALLVAFERTSVAAVLQARHLRGFEPLPPSGSSQTFT